MTSTSTPRRRVQHGPSGPRRTTGPGRPRRLLRVCGTGLLTAMLATAIPGIARAQPAASDSGAPTPIEQALMEYGCRVPGQATAAPPIYEACLRAQLLALRTDFGRDLLKLSPVERKAIDTTCSAVRTARGRDAYVGCMSHQLTTLRDRRAKAAPAGPVPVSPAEPQPASMEQVAAMLPSVTEPPMTESSGVLWMALLALASVGGGGWYLLAGRTRRPAVHLCRVCGGGAGATGDMCANCRHEAAEAQRRSLAERAEQQRAVADEARRAQEEAEARLRQEKEDARRVQALAKEAELARQQEEARPRDEELRRWQAQAVAAIAGPVETTFDPLAVLGLPASPTDEQIRKAYDEAHAKYAPDQVAHLGMELQDHYRKKLESVERAFEMLSSPARV